MTLKKILVLFKTHLDVGFTDLSANVVSKYNTVYIPQAIRVAEELQDCPEGFTWTTGSWLIDQYRRQASAEELARFDEAVRNKWIRWHGLPTTMHCEIADESLFQYGLSLSKKLDEHFGVKTIGGKFTDVPGFTRSVVPLMADAGIELLHIGVNPASAAPDVPMYFRWLDPASGKEITVMYNKGDYGEFSVLPGTETAIYFAHTGDNCGPSSAEHIRGIYKKLHEQYPEAAVTAGDLNDLAAEFRKIRELLPVITAEIGDTWIHGAGTDPKKLSQFRAMLRYAKTLSEEEREAMYRTMILVPEHTWGLDEKTWLNDTDNFSREDFYAVRGGEKCQKMESSWAEQRAYVTSAADALTGEAKEEAYRRLDEYAVPKPDFASMSRTDSNRTVLADGDDRWEIAWDETGAIVHLSKNGRTYADEAHPIAKFRYDAFTEPEVEAYQDRYIKPHMRRVYWAVHDLGKVGLSKGITEHCTAESVLAGAYLDDKTLVLHLTVSGDAAQKYGCPADMTLSVTPQDGSLLFDFAWYDKPACRIPEALWLGFNPVKPLTAVRKLGTDIHPQEVVSLGNREMHASEGLLTFADMTLEMIDAPLLAVEKPHLYAFYDQIPDTTKGIWANLFNNQWGTNFPMWNEGNARFRYILK